jgi:hypothetical protein
MIIRCSRGFNCLRRQKARTPVTNSPGFLFWRRPTLARPVAVLPSGLQRFTSVFGMGTGGATALGSPEFDAGLAVSPLRGERADIELWRRCRSWKELISYQQSAAADPLTSTYRSSFRLRTADGTTELRFVLRSFVLLCGPSPCFRMAKD